MAGDLRANHRWAKAVPLGRGRRTCEVRSLRCPPHCAPRSSAQRTKRGPLPAPTTGGRRMLARLRAVPLFGRRKDTWPFCSAAPQDVILREPPPVLRWFKMTTPPSDTPELDATTRFVSGKESVSINLGVFPTSEIAASAMRKMEAAILGDRMFIRRGNDLRGLGQMKRKADEDRGTEGIYIFEAAQFHFMRVANVAVCTTGLSLDDSDSPGRPLTLIQMTIEAQLDRLALLTPRNTAGDTASANG